METPHFLTTYASVQLYISFTTLYNMSDTTDTKAVGVLNVKRRTWKAEPEAEASTQNDRPDDAVAAGEAAPEPEVILPSHGGDDVGARRAGEGDVLVPGSARAYLRGRDKQVNLEKRVNTRRVVTAPGDVNQTSAFTSGVTGAVLRDSISYLNHINGKKYNQALGYSMRTERSSAADVKSRLAAVRAKAAAAGSKASVGTDDRAARIAAKLAEFDKATVQAAEAKKQQAAGKKRARAEAAAAEEDGVAAEMPGDMAAILGFTSFGKK